MVDSASGIVTARNMAGPVKVGAAWGVQCESGSGGINVSQYRGRNARVDIVGQYHGEPAGGQAGGLFLATGNGDITVYIPSNVG